MPHGDLAPAMPPPRSPAPDPVLVLDAPAAPPDWRAALASPEGRWLAVPLARLRARAEGSHAAVRRLGVVGLFVFMPFWMTGPVIGSFLGSLLGLRKRTTLAVVLAGTFAAIAVYAFLFDEVDAGASAYGRYAAFVVPVALAVLAMLVQRWRGTTRPPH
ncbi:MAG: hypothetical protein C0505_15745 [Leptothrix sp. (in: Bacteria)]|nr:hypothetical protein [Leptothrix sp. (in: b-proteobacteria)]